MLRAHKVSGWSATAVYFWHALPRPAAPRPAPSVASLKVCPTRPAFDRMLVAQTKCQRPAPAGHRSHRPGYLLSAFSRFRCTAPRCLQVPVLDSFPSPLVPATVEDERGAGPAISLTDQAGHGVVSPSRVRLREDMWVSSRTFYVLDAEVRTEGRGGGGGGSNHGRGSSTVVRFDRRVQ